jgi:uroporphyrinogen decarboxylase
MKLHNRKPDIENLYKVLRREEPPRPTLFELFMNLPLYERLAGRKLLTQYADSQAEETAFENLKLVVDAYAVAGYDYSTSYGSSFKFEAEQQEKKNTISLNEGFVITDEKSFESYKWPRPIDFDFSRLEKIRPFLPEGMKLMVMGPGGVLENVITLTGYENLCFLLFDEPDLTEAIFNKVGEALLKYYEIALSFDTVGLMMSNDDWGFKHQTLISPADMRKYVFPWHKKYADLAHEKKIPAVLHSCGYPNDIMDDVIDFIKYDGKHSFEDAIVPIEDSYERWHDKIAILGGIDVNFMIQNTEEDIISRCRAMLKRAEGRGAYALGTGNSVPEYIPQDNFIALLKAALEY